MRIKLLIEVPSASASEPVFALASALRQGEGITLVTPTGYKADVDLLEVVYIDSPFKGGGAPE